VIAPNGATQFNAHAPACSYNDAAPNLTTICNFLARYELALARHAPSFGGSKLQLASLSPWLCGCFKLSLAIRGLNEYEKGITNR
jgi:hypothetical protein